MNRATGSFVVLLAIAGVMGRPCLVGAQEAKPEFYGTYALEGGRLKETYKNSDLNDYSPTVRFVMFDRSLRNSGPHAKLFFIPPPKKQQSASSEFKGWDDFLDLRKQSQDLDKVAQMLTYGVPADAVEIPIRLGPYGGSDEMIRIVPSRDLPPGQYQLFEGFRFWVRRADVVAIYTDAPSSPNPRPVPSSPNPITPTQAKPVALNEMGLALDDSGHVRPRVAYVSNGSSAAASVGWKTARVIGDAGGRLQAELDGPKAAVRLDQNSQTILVTTPTNGLEGDCRIYRFAVAKGNRRVTIPDDELDCRIEVADSFIRITSQTPLPPGEYAVGRQRPPINPNKTITVIPFGIDPK